MVPLRGTLAQGRTTSAVKVWRSATQQPAAWSAETSISTVVFTLAGKSTSVVFSTSNVSRQIACWDGHGACAGSACSASSGACTSCTGCAGSAGGGACTSCTGCAGSAGGAIISMVVPVATPPTWPTWMLYCHAKAAKARVGVLCVAQFRAQLNKDLLVIQTIRTFDITT